MCEGRPHDVPWLGRCCVSPLLCEPIGTTACSRVWECDGRVYICEQFFLCFAGFALSRTVSAPSSFVCLGSA